MSEIEWAVIRRFPVYSDGEEHIVVDYWAQDEDDAERVLSILAAGTENTSSTRWRVASRPKVVWTDYRTEDRG